MIIGYDAKRAYQNKTGLGNYSRNLLDALMTYRPAHEYLLFTPRHTDIYQPQAPERCQVITPQWSPARQLPALWRSWWLTRDLRQQGVQLYHGLSNELPAGMGDTHIPSVVTIHDLIFERYPHLYDKSEVFIYRRKFRHACQQADAIIATSRQTKADIIDFYGIHPDKIHVCYQSCQQSFATPLPPGAIQHIRQELELPDRYFLYVGSIIERKRLLDSCMALKMLKPILDLPLVVVGQGKKYKQQVQQWLTQVGLQSRVLFLNDAPAAKASAGYQSGEYLPAIYQGATALIYPSQFEGFGIPVLEGLCSRVPVITTTAASLPEVGGDAALYGTPGNVEELAALMWKAATDDNLRAQCIDKGIQQAELFHPWRFADSVTRVYDHITGGGTRPTVAATHSPSVEGPTHGHGI